eukprot:2363761-Prorocentrum_lima.AAC.1
MGETCHKLHNALPSADSGTPWLRIGSSYLGHPTVDQPSPQQNSYTSQGSLSTHPLPCTIFIYDALWHAGCPPAADHSP